MIFHKLEFGEFKLYPDIMIGTIYEGVHFDLELNDIVCELARSHYGNDHSFGYISLRLFTYSIDPMVHYRNKDFENLKCFAVVDPRGIKPSATIESKFYFKDRFYGFYNLEDAMQWTIGVLHHKMQA